MAVSQEPLEPVLSLQWGIWGLLENITSQYTGLLQGCRDRQLQTLTLKPKDNSPVFRLQEEQKHPEETPHRQRENTQTQKAQTGI